MARLVGPSRVRRREVQRTTESHLSFVSNDGCVRGRGEWPPRMDDVYVEIWLGNTRRRLVRHGGHGLGYAPRSAAPYARRCGVLVKRSARPLRDEPGPRRPSRMEWRMGGRL